MPPSVVIEHLRVSCMRFARHRQRRSEARHMAGFRLLAWLPKPVLLSCSNVAVHLLNSPASRRVHHEPPAAEVEDSPDDGILPLEEGEPGGYAWPDKAPQHVPARVLDSLRAEASPPAPRDGNVQSKPYVMCEMVPVGVVVQSADGTVCSWNLRLMMQLLQAMELAATADHASLRTAAQLLQALSTLPMRERAMALSSIEWSLRDVSRPVWNFTDASNRVLGPLSLPDLARWCAAGRFAPCDTQALLCHSLTGVWMSLALACLLTGVPLTGLPEVQGTLARAGDGRGNQLRMLMPSASGSDATVSVQEGSLSKRTSTVTIAAGGSLGHGFYGLSQEAEAAAGPRPQVARAFSQLAPATRGLVHVSPGEGSNDGSRSLAASRRASGANNSALGTSPRVGSRVGSLKEEAGAGRRRADEDAEMTDLEAGLVEELRIVRAGQGTPGRKGAPALTVPAETDNDVEMADMMEVDTIKRMILVLDTNVLLANWSAVAKIMAASEEMRKQPREGVVHEVRGYLPYAVLNELDALKTSTSVHGGQGQTTGELARRALRLITENIARGGHTFFVGQSLEEYAESERAGGAFGLKNDDSILQACLQLMNTMAVKVRVSPNVVAHRGVVMATNDNALRVKAHLSGVQAMGIHQVEQHVDSRDLDSLIGVILSNAAHVAKPGGLQALSHPARQWLPRTDMARMAAAQHSRSQASDEGSPGAHSASAPGSRGSSQRSLPSTAPVPTRPTRSSPGNSLRSMPVQRASSLLGMSQAMQQLAIPLGSSPIMPNQAVSVPVCGPGLGSLPSPLQLQLQHYLAAQGAGMATGPWMAPEMAGLLPMAPMAPHGAISGPAMIQMPMPAPGSAAPAFAPPPALSVDDMAQELLLCVRSLAPVIEAALRWALGDLWEHVAKRDPPSTNWTAADCAALLHEHYQGVFSDLLPKGTRGRLGDLERLMQRLERRKVTMGDLSTTLVSTRGVMVALELGLARKGLVQAASAVRQILARMSLWSGRVPGAEGGPPV